MIRMPIGSHHCQIAGRFLIWFVALLFMLVVPLSLCHPKVWTPHLSVPSDLYGTLWSGPGAGFMCGKKLRGGELQSFTDWSVHHFCSQTCWITCLLPSAKHVINLGYRKWQALLSIHYRNDEVCPDTKAARTKFATFNVKVALKYRYWDVCQF